jgi:hypothetical protein
MPISPTDLQFFKGALLSDTSPAANGGRLGAVGITSGVKNNLFPDVPLAERTAGVTHWRKLFLAVRHASNLSLLSPKISLETPTPGDSYVLLYAGTQTDTQDQVTARPYGIGTLSSDAALGATTLAVTAESAVYASLPAAPFQAGDLIRIDARADVLSTGLSEYRTIDTVSYNGAAVSLTLTAPLEGEYASGSRVASVIAAATVATSVANLATTGALTFNPASLTLNQRGCVYQTWTITITNAITGALSISGDLLGSLGTGAKGATVAPVNPATGQPYFSLAAAGWGGTATNGDTLTFTTIPSAVPLWLKRVVPAGAGAIASDPASLCVEAEST